VRPYAGAACQRGVARLIKAASEGSFDHTAQRERDKRTEREAIAATTAELTEQGITVVNIEATYDGRAPSCAACTTPRATPSPPKTTPTAPATRPPSSCRH
jgi:hypothetical protein